MYEIVRPENRSFSYTAPDGHQKSLQGKTCKLLKHITIDYAASMSAGSYTRGLPAALALMYSPQVRLSLPGSCAWARSMA